MPLTNYNLQRYDWVLLCYEAAHEENHRRIFVGESKRQGASFIQCISERAQIKGLGLG